MGQILGGRRPPSLGMREDGLLRAWPGLHRPPASGPTPPRWAPTGFLRRHNERVLLPSGWDYTNLFPPIYQLIQSAQSRRSRALPSVTAPSLRLRLWPGPSDFSLCIIISIASVEGLIIFF